MNLFSQGVVEGTKVWVLGSNNVFNLLAVKDIKKGDFCGTFNFQTGKIETARIIEIEKSKKQVFLFSILNLDFSFGIRVKVGEICLSQDCFLLKAKIDGQQVLGKWVLAKDCRENTYLWQVLKIKNARDGLILVSEKIQQEEQDVFNFKLERGDNYFISELGIILRSKK